MFPIFLLSYWGVQLSITPERGKWEKGIHPKWDKIQGFLYFGHSNWSICCLLSWFCPKIFSICKLSYWGFQFIITPERGKWEKGIHPKVDETQGFLYLGYSNWTICRLLSWFCSKKFPLSWPLYWGSHFLLPQREKERKQQRLEMGKRESPKSGWDTGVSVLGVFKLDHLQTA